MACLAEVAASPKHHAPAALRHITNPRVYHTLFVRQNPTTRRRGLSCPRHHGSPPAILPARRTTIPQPPARVFKFEFPTAFPLVDRPTADTNTVRRSLLAPTRSVSARASCKKRKSRTGSSWMAISTRYVKEHVTQEQDWRWTPCRWELRRCAVPANGISRLTSCSDGTHALTQVPRPAKASCDGRAHTRSDAEDLLLGQSEGKSKLV